MKLTKMFEDGEKSEKGEIQFDILTHVNRRESSLAVFSVHPGIVKTELSRTIYEVYGPLRCDYSKHLHLKKGNPNKSTLGLCIWLP